ncbi:LysM domain-containing protein [Streptococcus chenjunshii]|uniref:LysM domain-containing protein n=1 Tax=Streptococcus chenjunshii TaxID=2173853 RepID=A0A372KKC1_9STRE|nr:LysM domain-containing protein [Streptococcus chenjunshii]AXQ77646.1 LysM domain-containing protein [Streptococcus chenjunshii]RFU50602.1 LysM domain-containing protein [Streptococcus chenjunshii]RFU52739.1 LysM domain-containing protein [Streptococcus chenjunshii]
MKKHYKILLTSTLLLSAFPNLAAQAQETAVGRSWTPRTLEEVKSDVVQAEDNRTYTVKYGDTLSTIAAALSVDIADLAKINQIADINLIFPDTVLTTSYDEQNQAKEVTIEIPAADDGAEPVVAEADLANNELVIEDQAIPLEDSGAEPTAEETAPVTEIPETGEEYSEPAADNQEQELEGDTADIQADQPAEELPAEEESAQEEPAAEPAFAEEETTETAEASEEIPAAEDTAETPAEEAAEPSVTEITEDSQELAAETAASTAAALTNPENAGLQPQAVAFKEEIASVFGISSFSLFREGADDDHGKGLAVDFMVPESSELGDQVAQYAIDSIGANNISYIIWKQRFYSPYDSIYGPAYTWNDMPDRGSVTENHYDHVHVSFNG